MATSDGDLLPPPRSADAPPADVAGGAGRLLVVDDEEGIRTLLVRALAARGYQVDVAASGAGALEAMRATRFVGMLCDVRMPGMSGTETLRRALAIDPDLAVLMLSAVNDAATASDALSAGALDYLVKPFEIPAFARAIER